MKGKFGSRGGYQLKSYFSALIGKHLFSRKAALTKQSSNY
jgi:hypothetical protein